MATIYYKTPRISETGKKFQKLLDRAKTIRKEITAFCQEQGGTGSYLHTNMYALGTDVVAIEFSEAPDPKLWKKHKAEQGYYAPRMNSKQGKELNEEMCDFPKIEIEELNGIVGFRENFLNSIGYNTTNQDFFGFILDSDWLECTNIPDDCQEITYTEYQNLSLKE